MSYIANTCICDNNKKAPCNLHRTNDAVVPPKFERYASNDLTATKGCKTISFLISSITETTRKDYFISPFNSKVNIFLRRGKAYTTPCSLYNVYRKLLCFFAVFIIIPKKHKIDNKFANNYYIFIQIKYKHCSQMKNNV